VRRESADRNEEEDYVASNIHFAMGGAVFGPFTEDSIESIAKGGLPGVEPYRGWLGEWLDRPEVLKERLDAKGIRLITASNGGAGQSTEFIDPAKRAETVADHATFCQDFLKVFGCTHFKINMGRRPDGGTSAEDIKAIVETVTEIGKRTLEMGVTVAPHPHIWGPIERPEEVRALLDQTDSEIVSWIPDTAQLNLGGGDPVQLVDDYYDRLAAVHFKDSKASYRGHTGPTPTKEMHQEEILYKDLGAGGVDHLTIYRMLVDLGYSGWITLDLDPPRSNEGEGSVDDKIGINCRYLREVLDVPNL
jgi:sugar phosphate isomerase/epimerase